MTKGAESVPGGILPTPNVPAPERVEFTVAGTEGPLVLRGHRWRNAVQRGPRPALVEFNPYRCRDGTLHSDSLMYPFFAEQGYDCYRIDLPGSGDSEGILTDEYSALELSCCRQVIEQVAGETWSGNGRVCMMGKSWSGINALMVAAFDPPAALAAVICCCGSDDRFNDDVHYMGGAMMADNFGWASSMFGWNFLPPDPAVTPDWQRLWIDRVDHADFWLRIWAAPENQARSSYWSATSVRDHYDKVKVPVFLLSGWQDGYKNVVPRAVAGLVNAADVRGLLGPWGHKYPFNGYPGPQIDWLRPVELWLRAWLKEAEPTPPVLPGWPDFLVWMGDSIPPPENHAVEPAVPGRWVAEDAAWAERVRPLRLHPAGGRRLSAAAPAAQTVTVNTARTTGAFAMVETSSWGELDNADLPGDLGPDDALSPTFDAAAFDEDVDLFGYPVFNFSFTAREKRGALCVRLSEIEPGGARVHLLSYSFINLTRIAGDEAEPRPLEPGRRYCGRMKLNALGHRLKAGWRLRLSLSTHWLPTLWPTTAVDAPVELHLDEHTWLELPRRPPRAEDAGAQPEPGIVTADADRYCPSAILHPASATRGVWRRMEAGRWVTEVRKSYDAGESRFDGPLDGLTVNQSASESHRADADAEHYAVSATCATELARPGWWARTETSTEVEWDGGATFSYRCSVTVSDHTGLRHRRDLQGNLERRWI